MKKSILSTGLFFSLLLFMSIAPVLAAPTVTPIKAIQLGTVISTEDTWTTNGGIIQNQGVLNEGTIKLFIPNTASSPTYTFQFSNVYSQMRNPEMMHSTIRVDVTWNYKVAGNVVGTFEGQIQWNIIDAVPQAHGVLHGTGIFEGQQLMFWKDNTQAGTVWVGTLMVK